MTALGLAVGATVICPSPDAHLRERHDVVAGITVGTVTRRSRLGANDAGWLVDWGTGGEVRCEPSELASANTRAWQLSVNELTRKLDLVAPYQSPGQAPAVFPRLGSQDLFVLAGRARSAGYVITGITYATDSDMHDILLDGMGERVVRALSVYPTELVEDAAHRAGVYLRSVEASRDGLSTVIGSDGSYSSGSDELLREVVGPWWHDRHPTPVPKSGWFKKRRARMSS